MNSVIGLQALVCLLSSCQKDLSNIPPISQQRQEKIYDNYNFFIKHFLHNVSHFDKKCCDSHLSLSLNHFGQAHLLTIVINNQKVNSVLSVLWSFI